MRFSQFKFAIFCSALAFFALFGTRPAGAKGEGADAGFLFDEFPLTLDSGTRTEAAGPFFYSEEKESDESTIAVPPIFSDYKNPGVEHSEFDLLYPLLTDEHYGKEWRWQFFELFSFAGGKEPDETQTHRFTLFPIYFQQRADDTNLDYTALFPIYGHLKNRLFRDQIYFVMFPIYGQSRKKDIVTDNYFYPFVHVRNGDGLHGWQVWPFAGREHKVLTTQTNGFGDVTVIGGHEHSFVLWPFWLTADENIGTENQETNRASLPFFAYTRSPLRDSTTVFWPFFSWIDERGRKYHEWEGPWPFVIFTRGEGKTTDRVWPIFSQSHNDHQESDSYIWPAYRYKRYHVAAFDEQRSSVMFYLYVGVTLTNNETGWVQKRRDMWPFFIWRRAFDGSTRLQVLAPLEPILVDSRGIERNWSPLWSVWRQAYNAKTGATSESLLWNLYRREAWPGDTVDGDTIYHKADHKKISLLFGLFRYERDGGHSETRLFYIPAFHSNK